MTYPNPIPTVDIIIEYQGGIVLIERKNPPFGWAIPGGFMDYGESAEACAIREAKEETSLDVVLLRQLKTYSDPSRDSRKHTIAIVFLATGSGELKADDDAKNAKVFSQNNLPTSFAFDHSLILKDYFQYKATGFLPI